MTSRALVLAVFAVVLPACGPAVMPQAVVPMVPTAASLSADKDPMAPLMAEARQEAAKLDANHDGKVTVEEIKASYASSPKRLWYDTMLDYSRVDRYSKQPLSEYEFATFHLHRKLFAKTTYDAFFDKVNGARHRMDKNEDELLSREEFTAGIAKAPAASQQLYLTLFDRMKAVSKGPHVDGTKAQNAKELNLHELMDLAIWATVIADFQPPTFAK